MIWFPNAKINIGLNIVRKRADGFHDLETVFYPVPWKDALEILPAESKESETQFSSYGNTIPINSTDNLCLKAYRLLQKEVNLPPVRMALLKNIPSEAGLGGGSADAAFTLSALNEFFKLGLSRDHLSTLALTLGSDCPFFIYNSPVFAVGRGERLEHINLNLKGYFLVIIKPSFSISTKEAFAHATPSLPSHSLKELILQPLQNWKNDIKNDFEASLAGDFPQIEELKTLLYESGALYSSLSGSGSAVYGIFDQEPSISVPLPNCRLFSCTF